MAVRTTEQTAAFLKHVGQNRRAVMWWLIALRGLRRGEAAGLRRVDVDLNAGVMMIEQQRLANGHLVTAGPPKNAVSRRLVALDRHTIRFWAKPVPRRSPFRRRNQAHSARPSGQE